MYRVFHSTPERPKDNIDYGNSPCPCTTRQHALQKHFLSLHTHNCMHHVFYTTRQHTLQQQPLSFLHTHNCMHHVFHSTPASTPQRQHTLQSVQLSPWRRTKHPPSFWNGKMGASRWMCSCLHDGELDTPHPSPYLTWQDGSHEVDVQLSPWWRTRHPHLSEMVRWEPWGGCVHGRELDSPTPPTHTHTCI